MPYPILDPATGPDPRFHGLCALTIMAKAPRPGRVKTRLSPPLTAQQAATINVCFLQDTARNLAEVAALTGRAAGLVSYTPIGEEGLFNNLLPDGFNLIPQRGDNFGDRLHCTAQDVLAKGFSSVCLIDSDSPTVPAAAYVQAVQELQKPGNRIILGPTLDGGYYLIGLKIPHPEPFTEISWSTASVADETRTRCLSTGIEVVELPLWYDVDDATTLRILISEVLFNTSPTFTTMHGYPAENTATFLAQTRSLFLPAFDAEAVLP